jgi:ribonuclease E
MATGNMAKKMLIDATHPEETRVVVADGNKVDDFDFESINKRQLAGNIYLAKVTRVEPSLQAAFVDYGGNRHGFLAFSEIHPDYYQIPVADREALLAEEAAEQQRSAANEEDRDAAEEEEKPRSRSRRGRRRTRSKPAGTKPEGGAISGLEVIDLGDEDTSSESAALVSGLEIAPRTQDVAGDETEPEPVAEGSAAEEDALTDAASEETPAEAIAPDVPDAEVAETEEPESGEAESEEETGSRPKSIAESSGLDDEESVSEDILEATLEKAEPDQAGEPEAVSPSEDAPEDATVKVGEAEAEAEPPTEEKKPARRRRSRAKKETPETVEVAAEEAAEEPAADAEGKTETSGEPSDEDEEGPEAAEAVESLGADDTQEEAARARARARRRRHYKIQDVIKVRQIMLVQVVKEERGNKGAALTTYLSLAGRYCVLMPNTARGGGISRKITSAGDRKRLRDITGELHVPQGMGLIVRTAGAERTRAEIKRDYEFLLRQWEQVRDLTLKSIAPTLIYEEGSLIKRSIRDLYSKEIDTVLVEGEAGYREAKDYMKMLMPSHARNVQQYTDQIPLFIRYQVESYLNGMFNPTVQLKSGGYIVIGVTEALVAIDVNSGRSTREASIEETALKTNLEAADEIARQLRLRDLAGLIVIDFIDMEDSRNNRAVERRMKERLKTDRARIQVGRISAFGLMEMSRQRLRPGMLEATTQPCPHCQGQGIIRSDESLALSILREVEEEGVRGRSAEVTVTAPVQIANYIMNVKRAHLTGIEQRYGLTITVFGDATALEPRVERVKGRARPVETADVVITAESAVSASALEEAEASVSAGPEEREDRGEGRGRRRRGRRGGQRRRREPEESAPAESAAGATEDSSTEAAGGAEDERRERRSRRRRGGRGRQHRQEEAVTEAVSESAEEPTETAEEKPTAPEPAEAATVAEATADREQEEASAAEAAQMPAEAPAEEPAATEPEAATEESEAEATPEDEAAPAPEVEEPIREPEPVAAAPIEPEPEKPAGPKRRGWWSRG